jgi:hypothetical protein
VRRTGDRLIVATCEPPAAELLDAVHRALGDELVIELRDGAPVERTDRDLPIYTVLVPVYREANVIGDPIENLATLDYPEEKLEVLVSLRTPTSACGPPSRATASG